MFYTLITKKELGILDETFLKYSLVHAEKDYFLNIVSDIISVSKLQNKMILRGSFALYHYYLPKLRFCEKLEYSLTDASLTIEDLKNVFGSYPFLKVATADQSDKMIRISELNFNGPIGSPNAISLEVTLNRDVLFPVKKQESRNIWKIKTVTRVMDLREIFEDKLLTLSGTPRYRDFMDVYFILENSAIKMIEVTNLIKIKGIKDSINKEAMLNNWQRVRETREDELAKVYCKKEILDSEVEKILRNLPV